ncbi:PRC-barrel domain containing protein [Pseudarthrobacter sp. BRE9]|uniref:PRC-barrel domain containing protein n=1 Tax=Pseudarthrobacter sp. BRE9 TaxID=2962582 RepID=UPI0028826C2E|nr:PRC-barrel domain containing protein [Pseudarthrobacter sp. BRE9]MDT0169696.1 PRC-barrel domain containing protein [Pseudarthrobacter sp. BRE9]
MILGDLLSTPVHDADGGRLGRVADARFVLDGAPHQLMAEPRLLGLVVSPHSVASFLGYERNGLTRPWLLARILRWRHRGSFLVLWEDIAMVGPRSVRLRPGFTRYSTVLEEDGQG